MGVLLQDLKMENWYVTAHEIDRENRDMRIFYISDMNCPNPIYLERLLL